MDDAASGATAAGSRSEDDATDLVARVLRAIDAADVPPGEAAVVPLVSLDVLGPPAADLVTRLARLADVGEGTRVLDVGSGVGTAARLLARAGASVVALDLAEEVCALARALAERTATLDRIEVGQGNATDLRFEEETFDVVWIAHVAAVVEDKHALFTEARRVLRRGGRLALLEPVAGPSPVDEPLPLPLPWAGHPGQSYLESSAVLARLAEATGHRVVHEEDLSAGLAASLEALVARGLPSPAPTAYLVDAEARISHYAQVLRSGRVRCVLKVAEAS